MDKSTIFFLDDLFPTEKLLLKEQFQGLTKTHYANLINLSRLLFQKRLEMMLLSLKKTLKVTYCLSEKHWTHRSTVDMFFIKKLRGIRVQAIQKTSIVSNILQITNFHPELHR